MGLRRAQSVFPKKLFLELLACLIIGISLWVIGNFFNFFPKH